MLSLLIIAQLLVLSSSSTTISSSSPSWEVSIASSSYFHGNADRYFHSVASVVLASTIEPPATSFARGESGPASLGLNITWFDVRDGSTIAQHLFAAGERNVTHQLGDLDEPMSGKHNFVVATLDTSVAWAVPLPPTWKTLSLTAFDIRTGSIAWALASSKIPKPEHAVPATLCMAGRSAPPESYDPLMLGYSADTGTILFATHVVNGSSAKLVIEAKRARRDGTLSRQTLWTWSNAFMERSTVNAPTCISAVTLVPDASTIAVTLMRGNATNFTAEWEMISLEVETGKPSCYPTTTAVPPARWNQSNDGPAPVRCVANGGSLTQWNGLLSCTQDDQSGSRDSTLWLATADCAAPLAVSDKLRELTGFEPTLSYINLLEGYAATRQHAVTWWQDAAQFVCSKEENATIANSSSCDTQILDLRKTPDEDGFVAWTYPGTCVNTNGYSRCVYNDPPKPELALRSTLGAAFPNGNLSLSANTHARAFPSGARLWHVDPAWSTRVASLADTNQWALPALESLKWRAPALLAGGGGAGGARSASGARSAVRTDVLLAYILKGLAGGDSPDSLAVVGGSDGALKWSRVVTTGQTESRIFFSTISPRRFYTVVDSPARGLRLSAYTV